MGDEDDWQKLTIEDKVVHKVWKARLAGYEEAAKRFRLIDDEKSPEYNNFLGLIKKFVIDSNAVAQEKGLTAVLSYVENAACATKCCGDVISGIVTKVLNARPKTKQLGIDICLMYIELEKQDIVIEELTNGFGNKQPKIIAACIQTVCQALREFGGKVIMMKGLVKQIPILLGHSDKTVRAEAKQLAIEIYKWIRDAIKPQLQNIKPVQLKELEDEWANVDPAPPKPTRFTKSEQAKIAAAPPPVETTDGDNEESDSAVGAGGPAVVVDPYDLFDPVEILSKLPKDFYEQVESKKWQERKEALEALDKLTSNPKLEPGQYGEVCAVLKKIITKDSNINVVALAAKCVTGLANGLRKKFQTYSGLLISAIFGKFKEKKLNVVIALRDAVDAVFATTNFTSIMEDLLAALDNKNPSIKDETCKFLTRVFIGSTPATLPKAVLKQIAPAVVKKLDDTVGPVRDSAAECLGTAMKVIGERAMVPYLETLDKLKQDKVKEFFDKAELTAAPGGGSGGAPAKTAPSKPTAAPAKKEPAKKPSAVETTDSKPPAKKAAGKSKKAVASKKTAGKTAPKKKKKKGDDFNADQAEPIDPEMPEGTVECKAEEMFGEARLTQMASSNWKERLEAVDEMTKVIEGMSGDSINAQVVVRTLARKPGWKDSNIQVLNGKFKLLAAVAAKSDFTRRSAWYAIAGLTSKIGDIKLKTQVKETLKIFAENISLNYISLKVAKAAEEAKNPKLQTEALIWMSESVREFGFRIDLKPHVAFIKTSLAHVNPGVRKAAIEFLATLYIFVGANLRIFFEEEKAALLQQIDSEFEKVKDEKPPAPTRRYKDDEEEEAGDEGGEEGEDDAEDGGGSGSVSLEDMVDRVSISDQLTDAVLAKIMDKNWKIRKEGLEEVQGFITAAKFITPDINELPASLKARLSDNNKVLVTMAISICKQLAESGGNGMSRHKSVMLPALIGTFSDAKPHLRKAGEEALDAWHSKIGFLPLLDNDILSTAMRESNPNLKATLLGWLEKKLPNEKKLPAELKDCIPPLFCSLEDRNPDVRKAAQAVVPLMMAHVGFESMSKATSKLDPSSKTVVQGILEKAKEVCVPIAAPGKKSGSKAASKGAGAAQAAKSAAVAAAAAASAVESTKEPVASKKTAPKKDDKHTKAESKKTSAPSKSRSKKDVVEDDGPAILHKIGKAERIKDEKKLKVLKWNFTTPRDEMVEQLKDQMAPCFSPSMHVKLFHKDFKFHIEAVAILTNAVTEYNEAVMESLDLILKWVTLRFFDTNTSVLLKTLEFLNALFNMMESNEKHLSAFEASAFIPYLVGKIGDPKDNVRKSVRDICKLITSIYPASKMFTYLMEGLASKNSKSRMECCDELGFLITKFGMEVCQPGPKVLKEIAGQISDRDNGVRSAALNCIVAAYNIIGEAVYKYVGRLPEKDQSYLEERIKRTGKKDPGPPPKTAAPAKARQAVERPKTAKNPDSSDGGQERHEPVQSRALQRPATAPNIKREFELDFQSIEGDEGELVGSMPKLRNVDLSDVLAAASIPQNLRQAYTDSNKKNQTMNQSTMEDVATLLDLTIAKISSADIHVAMESLIQLEDVFKKKKTDSEILKRIDQYLVTSLVQSKMLFSRHIENKQNSSDDLERVLKLLLSGMLALFDAQCYASLVSRNVLRDVILYFITVLNDKVLEKFEEPELSIQCVNRLLLRVITNSDKTSCLGACVKLLQELSENLNTSATLIKLVMKCIWKLTHLLPEFIAEVKLDSVVLDIHNFYKVLPASFWRNRSDRVPQQTVKALLQTLCKLRGDELLECLNTIEDKNASEVPLFILKHCSKGKLLPTEKVNFHPSAPPVKVGPPTNEALVEIFKKIGSKENSRTGIIELYYFKKKYPDYNVDPFIKNTSPFFQSFIDRSLKTIALEENEKQSSTNGNTSSRPLTSNSVDSNISSDSAKYLDRLQALKDKYQKSSSNQTGVSSINTTTDISQSPPEEEPQPTGVPEVKANTEEKKNFDLDDIKRRLELIKAGKK